MRIYVELLRQPGILRVTLSQLLARLPMGMLSLAVLMHVQATSDSYAVAGAVVAAMSIGQGGAVPLTSRLVGRFGIRVTLESLALINAAFLVALAVLPLTGWILAVIGFCVGATVPPVMPTLRAIYPQLVERDAVAALFSLDTTSQELIWIAGPVVATALAASLMTSAPLLFAAAVVVLGTTWLITTPRLKELRLAPGKTKFGRVLGSRVLALAMIGSCLLVASFTALQVGIVAQFERSAFAGVAIAISAVGSLVGGLTVGHRRLRIRGMLVAFGVVAIGTGCAAVAPGVPLFLLGVFLSGFGFAPALATLYYLVSRDVTEVAAPEAYGWLATASQVGGALGAAVAGVFEEGYGAFGAYAVATAFALLVIASPAVIRLRGPIAELWD